ncbi:hypothetical protein NDA11_001202 [Ustilago hordei]|uniref:Uncharacterized protein n=1 Tax=Ustilago hordei TaxID=120017 RepID=I2FU98_USTHO|nr:uncharacterized protein UHO2_04902 [Ustilago hordei]KAJ1043174.1 hypothetical protein NDA10_007143 [Ustilago hordei]KAJ1573080.1 hypothetical protein NDA12_004853 [Ustilago hordei]KAJ1577446.1 hypothetical protein NDA11_001202 [Ustilago hordei]KAJ1582139.1 hypothetical protein NDA15_003542 [Ustilago hordei]UTT89372.1 hypothetical protein NDA17_005122 [Ustilago hordei]
MRTVVFLPPPTLAKFDLNPCPVTFQFDLGTVRNHMPSTQVYHRPGGNDKQTAAETAKEDGWVEAVQVVPDSVDPVFPTLEIDAEGEWEESIAKSIVRDAPPGVPWEVFHPQPSPPVLVPTIADETHPVDPRAEKEEGRGSGRKKVRIESPVLVIETPERNPASVSIRASQTFGEVQGQVDPSRVHVDAAESIHGEEEEEEEDGGVDKSRVNVGDDSAELSSSEDGTRLLHRSLRLGFAGIAASAVPDAARDHVERMVEAESSNNASESSLQIRVPVAAFRPAATATGRGRVGRAGQTCKFSFFSKPSSRSTTSFVLASAAERPPPIAAPKQDGSKAAQIPSAIASAEARIELPEMNDHNATLAFSLPSSSTPSHPSHLDSMLAGQSILPPPTLHFTLSSITPVSRILSHPSHFLPSSHSRPGMVASAIPGAISHKVNLLVVVKQVGQVTRVRNKYPVDKPKDNLLAKIGIGRAETRGRSSSAFTEAIRNENMAQAGSIADGKTERVELIVMDGRMSSIRRLLPSDSQEGEGGGEGGRVSVVEEAAEKCYFKVVLWGKLAREWTTDPPSPPARPEEAGVREGNESSLLLTHHLSRTTPSETSNTTALRPGDVIHLENLNLTRTTPSNNTDSLTTHKRSRLGTGFPPRDAYQPQQHETSVLTAQASNANSSRIDLCYRSDVQDKARDGRWNFHPHIAQFDFKSRRILELSNLWNSSNQKSY